MEKEIKPDSNNKVYCSVCEMEQTLTACDYCGELGSKECKNHWECKYGGTLSYSDNLPWFSHAKPGNYCFNCSVPPH